MKLIIYLSYLFFVSELALLILKRSKKPSAIRRNDKGSLLILWCTIIITLTAGFYIANYGSWGFSNNTILYFGIIIFLSGVILRWCAIFQLKKAFTVNVAINKEHTLKTNGLYTKIRHPSYSGLLLVLAGLSVSMSNIISFLVISISIFAAINYRIYVEEKVLTEEFGHSYIEYKAKTKKIIPGLF